MTEERGFAVFANSTGSKVFKPGTLLMVVRAPDSGYVEVAGMARGGRMLTKWEPLGRMRDFRVKWAPPRFVKMPGALTSTRQDAEQECVWVYRVAGRGGE